MTFPNPVLPGCHPDPSVCRVGEDYYLVTSTFEYFPGLPVFHSRDLVRWTPIGHVVDRHDQLDMDGIESSGGLFAPTLREHDGVFWLVCTLVDRHDDTRGGNFVMTAPHPSGPWSDPVWLKVDGIDPSLFFDDDGRVWLHGTRLARDPDWHDQTEVWLRELDPRTMSLVGPEHVLWNGALLGAVWAEAPHLYKVDGTYYLLAAEGGTEFHHAVAVARSGVVTGPYEGNRANPVLTHRHLGRSVDVVGVGHADLVEAVDGSWWAVLLGMRPYGGYHYNLGRETFLVPVTWEDGWPVFAPGVGRVTLGADGEGAAGPAASPPGGVVPPDDHRWTSLRRPATQFATAHGDGWLLRMSPVTLVEPLTPAFLGVRQQHRDVDLRVTLRVGELGPHEEVGVAVRQSERDHVTLALAPDADGGLVARAVHRRAGTSTPLGQVVVGPPGEGTATLTISARGQDYALTAASGDDDPVVVGLADGRHLDSVAAGGFLGLWLGVFATSNGNATDTVVEVVRVEYLPGT